MSAVALNPRQSACLQRLADWTETVMEMSMRRIEAAEGRDFLAEVGLFNDLGRSLRLTLSLEMRLANAAPLGVKARDSARPERAEAVERPETLDEREILERPDTLARPDNDDRPMRLEFERESETERDAYPDTPLGRAEALEALLARGSHLDPDGRITAKVIQIKTFLTEGSPEPPGRGPPPPRPQSPKAPSASDPPLSRPPNRAERRRLRRSSG